MYLCQNPTHTETWDWGAAAAQAQQIGRMESPGWRTKPPGCAKFSAQIYTNIASTASPPWEAGAIPDVTEQREMTWMQQIPNFLVPPGTNWKSFLQFPSPDFSWFNNTPEFKHRHPSLSPPCTQSISNPWNYSWLGLEQPTGCQFYMFYKATACRKQLKCRSYQACDPQSNQRLPETVIQGSISFLQEKWNICGPEN